MTQARLIPADQPPAPAIHHYQARSSEVSYIIFVEGPMRGYVVAAPAQRGLEHSIDRQRAARFGSVAEAEQYLADRPTGIAHVITDA